MIRLWKVIANRREEIHLPDSSSLDAITRQLPDGYYSTFRTHGNCTRVLGLKAHLHRLPEVDASSLRRKLILLLEPFRADEARVRVVQTFQGQIYIAIEPLKLLSRSVYEIGVRVETATIHRDSPRIKSTAFISVSDSERKHIAQLGIFESLLVRNGKILEGMTSNFFYVEQVANLLYVFTAQRDILLGVTRRNVIRAARRRGVEVRYRALGLSQLAAVKEAFITSSSRGIVPVIVIDGVRVGQGSPGKVTRLLMSAYDEYVLKKAEVI